ncbi:dihydroorotase [Granulosicoccus sp.]|nr:dihydroorotase [Granulosicoccus sp.]
MNTETTQITLRTPDDWHLHLRDGDMLNAVVGASATRFSRALIMPNLVPPVVTGADARGYRERIDKALTDAGLNTGFTPMMTLYLTEQTQAQDVIDSAADGTILAVKLYPAGATTNSASGVANLDRVMPVLEAMAANNVVLCVHGEVTDAEVDIFDREARFIETVLDPLRQRLPELRVVMEHITTRDGSQYVSESKQNLAGTITPHHLLINRNHMLVGGIRPHYYCLPILKREEHRQALVTAATSGDARFFLGTDSAPHSRLTKENDCGCAGVFNAVNTVECVATVFDQAQAMEHLEAFISLNGASWYGLPANTNNITLVKRDDALPLSEPINVGKDTVTPFDPAQPIYWHVV